MSEFRLALANLRYPATPEESIELAVDAIGRADADLICFPECYVPGYGRVADRAFLERAWSAIAAVAARAKLTVVLGTQRIVDRELRLTALVTAPDGTLAGFQDKVQLDPSEEGAYKPGVGRRLFRAGGVTFGVVICHEGWRYPETVRWAVRNGAELVLHPHFHPAGDRTFHEHAPLCRAAENTCWFATVNCACAGAPTTSAIVKPDGTLLAQQPYGQEGLLVSTIDPAEATRLLAMRYASPEQSLGN